MEPMHLLLLEDDTALGQALAEHLCADGHQVRWCREVAQAEFAGPVDLALVDRGLPDGDGLALLQRWRAAGHRWPVIMVSAREQVSDRIRSLQAGADDYLVKPFDLHELTARVLAVARRCALPTGLQVGALQIDPDARSLRRDGQPVDLTAMEWTVLAGLARRPGRIWSRNEIDDWLHDAGLSDVSSNSLEVIVSRLRKKLGAGCISTHRHLGYRLDG